MTIKKNDYPYPPIHTEEEPVEPKPKPDNDFFDYLQGNKYTHGNQLLHWTSNLTAAPSMFDHEFSLDYFVGLLGGEFPYHNKEIYHSDVLSAKI